ncbi:MAG: YcjX family protein [Pseudomonadota bacterium]
MRFTSIVDEAQIALGGLADYASDLVNPTIRLGVTGLSRAGKTVFITALVHNLLNGGRLPMFAPYANGRIKRAFLQPQPDDDVPRFDYEKHLEALTSGDDRDWPQSTRRISQLRLTIEYEPEGFLASTFGQGQLNIDIVDYPGEWLLDLPLLDMSYSEWSSQALSQAQVAPRDILSKEWVSFAETLDPDQAEDEQLILQSSKLYTKYLQKCREDAFALSTVPPGRFLMPGDMEGSPLITFAPLVLNDEQKMQKNSLGALMERRYNAYVSKVVKPFFLNHFSRLDRQVVLVDLLSALNAGPAAVADVKMALTAILDCFRPGKNSWLNAILGKRIERILFAATKADQLNHIDHDHLENILKMIVSQAISRTEDSGAEHNVAAIASIRATREHTIMQGNEELPAIIGIPKNGEKLDKKTYDGKEEIAFFPGDLPDNPKVALSNEGLEGELEFLRFRPPLLSADSTSGSNGSFPHIRLDKVLNFLISDRL